MKKIIWSNISNFIVYFKIYSFLNRLPTSFLDDGIEQERGTHLFLKEDVLNNMIFRVHTEQICFM